VDNESAGPEAAVLEVLERSRRLGFVGPGPISTHVEHAVRVLRIIAHAVGPGRGLDLGSGGGVPGLVLAVRRPEWSWVRLDARQRRTDFLEAAVRGLDLDDRVDVVCARAEEAGRDPALREMCDLVVARSFGPPPVTAECGAPFLVVGGRLVVSEPPEPDPRRWPAVELQAVGLGAPSAMVDGWVSMELVTRVGDGVPRANGRPAKRPLWT
jgi:16S rRNA (guanine527-N7)-methyltransferase